MIRIASLFVASALVVVPAVARDSAPTNWRAVASDRDRDRLRNARQAWIDALAKARTMNARAIAAQGALFDPDVALAGAAPPAGDYRCRVFKLGAKEADNLDYVAYPGFRCRIAADGAQTRLTKLDGSQRPTGVLYDDGQYRRIFLGSLALGDERRAFGYGRDEARDVAGIVERVGPRLWRLVIPYPRFESVLDVIELVPIR